MQATTIGAYPRPEELAPIQAPAATPEGSGPAEASGVDSTTLLDEATARVVREQVEAGIDIPTDGALRRSDPIEYHCRHLDGIDLQRLSEVESDEGIVRLPTVIGPVRARQPFLTHDWRVAQRATSRPVKMTLPGPLSLADGLADRHYDGDARRLSADLADALNRELRMLAAAGCRYVQIDEPVFIWAPDAALAFGIEQIDRCFYKLPPEVRRILRLAADPDRLRDEHDPADIAPEAANEVHAQLLPALDGLVDAVAIEDARRPNDLRLLESLERSSVILGVIDVARVAIETQDAVYARLDQALQHIDRERLAAGPDGGLALLPRGIARAKLDVLAKAAHSL